VAGWEGGEWGGEHGEENVTGQRRPTSRPRWLTASGVGQGRTVARAGRASGRRRTTARRHPPRRWAGLAPVAPGPRRALSRAAAGRRARRAPAGPARPSPAGLRRPCRAVSVGFAQEGSGRKDPPCRRSWVVSRGGGLRWWDPPQRTERTLRRVPIRDGGYGPCFSGCLAHTRRDRPHASRRRHRARRRHRRCPHIWSQIAAEAASPELRALGSFREGGERGRARARKERKGGVGREGGREFKREGERASKRE
jgi:hypothetical protein